MCRTDHRPIAIIIIIVVVLTPHSQGNSIAIVQGTRGSSGSVNPYVVDLLRGAHAAGIPFVDVYVFLNFKRGEPAVQMREVLDFIQASGQRFGMLWHDIEGPKYFGECPENRKFLQEALAEGERRGIRQGIYSSASQWQPIMCGAEEFSHYPLWYAHYDNRPDFSSFRPFGGWDRPVMKQYMGTTDLCGTQVDLNFYP